MTYVGCPFNDCLFVDTPYGSSSVNSKLAVDTASQS
jgi:hypothetical protein